MLKGQELKTILIDSKAKVFITHNACFETLTGHQKDLNLLRESVLVDEIEGKEGLVPLEKLKEKGSHKFSAICMEPDDPAAIIYTAGTTGMPKGAVFTHDGLFGRAKAMNFLFGNLKLNDRILNVAPLSSSLTIAGVVITAFLHGASIYLMNGLTLRNMLRPYVRTTLPLALPFPPSILPSTSFQDWAKGIFKA